MPRSRNQRRRRAAARFAQVCHQRNVEQILLDEEAKIRHEEYLKGIKVQKGELLTRTIYVNNVRDLNKDVNLRALRLYMESMYGPVDFCVKVKPTNRNRRGGQLYPPALIRFRSARDAEKLFGGILLNQVKGSVLIPCDLGCKQGCIAALPSLPYPNMLTDDESLRGEVITIDASCLALGHWCPDEHDMIRNFSDDVTGLNLGYTDEDLYVEEICLNQTCQLRIDLYDRKVEISTSYKSSENMDDGRDILDSYKFDAIYDLFGEPKSSVLSFRFKDIWNHFEICRERDDRHQLALLFVLKDPPKLENIVPSLNDGPPRIERRTDYPGVERLFFGRCRAFKLSVDASSLNQLSRHEGFAKLVDFGILRSAFRSSYSFDHCDARFIRTRKLSPSELRSMLERYSQGMKDVHDTDVRVGFVLRAAVDQYRFSWYCLLNDQDSTGATLPNFIRRLGFRDQLMVIQVLNRICSIEGGRTNYPMKLFQAIMAEEDAGTSIKESSMPHYCLKIPRLLLTPCQVKVLGYVTEMSNRVLRYFVFEEGFSPSSFLRVSVGDENGQKLFGGDLSSNVETLLRQSISSGVTLNGRTYRFLAYSSSQLKECSLWMVCLESSSWTVESIRRYLGDFSKCLSASKYAARIGQCFSTTFRVNSDDYYNLRNGGKKLRHAVIPDIPGTGNFSSKLHTDGTGLISRQLMDELLRQVPFAPKNFCDCSIIQIRYGGAKGTLTAWDERVIRQLSLKTTADVLIRESMLKFDVVFGEIEICSVGNSIPYYLNRNVILILSCLNVPDETFLELQREMLDDLDAMIISTDKAWEILPRLSGPDASMRSVLDDMLSSGLEPKHEPFLFSCLHAIRSHHLFRLRKKTRILVSDGAVLMGGLDETGLLPEGCVYVHSSRFHPPATRSNRNAVVMGPVMVTKHPVMHIGDVRMLLAIHVPELEGHCNVVLFSRHGQRPEPDKMAGSDLDGDEFAVTWDRRLFLNGWNGRSCKDSHFSEDHTIFARSLHEANRDPLDYKDPDGHGPPAFPQESDAQSKALIDHFSQHAKTDNLGRIAMLWQDHASRNSADCDQCHELARLHSIAVDFPKSGIPATIPDGLFLKPHEERAHWRELKRFPNFHCDQIVGQLYDEVISRTKKDRTLVNLRAFAGRDWDRYGLVLATSKAESLHRLQDVYNRTIPDGLGLVENGRANLLAMASEQRDWYEEDIASLMNKYKIRSEGELITGCIRKLHKLHRRREHDVAEEIRRSVRHIRTEHRHQFFVLVNQLVEALNLQNSEAGDGELADEVVNSIQEVVTREPGNHFDASEQVLRRSAFRLAAAYYTVAYTPSQWIDAGEKFPVRFSFPWVICSDIIRVGLEEACSESSWPSA